MNWEEDLEIILANFVFDPIDSWTLLQIEQEFQRVRPGPYTISWGPENTLEANLDFPDEETMIFWLLKNS